MSPPNQALFSNPYNFPLAEVHFRDFPGDLGLLSVSKQTGRHSCLIITVMSMATEAVILIILDHWGWEGRADHGSSD